MVGNHNTGKTVRPHIDMTQVFWKSHTKGVDNMNNGWGIAMSENIELRIQPSNSNYGHAWSL